MYTNYHSFTSFLVIRTVNNDGWFSTILPKFMYGSPLEKKWSSSVTQQFFLNYVPRNATWEFLVRMLIKAITLFQFNTTNWIKQNEYTYMFIKIRWFIYFWNDYIVMYLPMWFWMSKATIFQRRPKHELWCFGQVYTLLTIRITKK